MMLSEQDREWVKAIVREAITEAFSESKSYVHKAVKEHTLSCKSQRTETNVMSAKVFMIGLAIGSGLVGGSVVGIIKSLFERG